ncbi:MAG: arsenate reductase ArsC [Terriglobia bacterium]
MHPVRVLFLCTGNSCRSQMAEGLLRRIVPPAVVEVASAGTNPKPVHPDAIRIMREILVDISAQRSKPLDQFLGREFDYVITLCDEARQVCPTFPGAAERHHWSLPDPAAAQGPEEERLAAFRAVRNDLATRIDGMLESIFGKLLEKAYAASH